MSTDALEPSVVQRELQRLLDETGTLSEQNLPEHVFFGELLSRLARSLESVAGAVWLSQPQGLRAVCVAGWEQTGLGMNPAATARHAQLLQRCCGERSGACFEPASEGTNGESSPNPTPWLMCVVPIVFRQEIVGVLEVFQRPDGPRDGLRHPLETLQKYAAITKTYLLQRKLAEAGSIDAQWMQWDTAAAEVGKRLDLRYTALAIASESRRLAGCDRASVVVLRGTKMRLKGASGMEEINKRAATVSALQRLAKAVCQSGQPLLADQSTADQPSTVDEALKDCLELTNAKTVVVLPLYRPTNKPEDATERPPSKPEPAVGALILEQIGESVPASQLVARLGPTTRHAAAALANTVTHEGILLLPVWRTLGRGVAWLQVHTFWKSAAILGALALIIGLLGFYPARLEVEGKGTLQPLKRREVFAEVDGEIINVKVHHDEQVQADQVLAIMRNTEIEIKRLSLEGERSSTQERILGIESMLSGKKDAKESSRSEQQRLHGERAGLQTTLVNLDRQIELLTAKKQLLEVQSPIAGRVLTWNTKETLLYRPVKRGDALLTVADTAGDWELQVHLPEDRTGILSEAQRAATGQPLVVRYIAANQPHKSLEGRLREVHDRAETAPEQGSTVLLSVDIDRSQIVDLRPGAEVTARVQCGHRALGYVLFHDAWAFLRTKVLFRWF